MTDPRDERTPAVSPKRLLEDNHPLSGTLRAYTEHTRFGFGEARAWEALQLRRGQASAKRPLVLLSALALAVTSFAVWSARHHANHVPIAAETLPPRRVVPAVAPPFIARDHTAQPVAPTEPASRELAPKKVALSSAPRAVPSGTEAVPLAARVELTANSARTPAVLGRPEPASVASVAPPSPPAPALTQPENHPDPCIQQQRAGHYELALRCFQNVASGNGVGAELALYEQARLESAVLGQPEAALKTLADHLRRFPAGALTSEARLMKLGLLAQTGSGRALPEVEAALQSPLGSERRGDLLFLRANILKARGRCTEALASYAEAEQAGISHLRIERAARQCQGNH